VLPNIVIPYILNATLALQVAIYADSSPPRSPTKRQDTFILLRNPANPSMVKNWVLILPIASKSVDEALLTLLRFKMVRFRSFEVYFAKSDKLQET